MACSSVVGALTCQKDSYLHRIDAEVVSCVKSPKSKQDLWWIEFSDSVLFPEGGGQPSDHGTLLPLTDPVSDSISITNVQRQGLRCIFHSPKPLTPGTIVRQEVDYSRRWDHMQQHTGQHVLSAIMDRFDNLETLGWGMGADQEPNYVDLPRKPSDGEIKEIQAKCNEVIRRNLKIVVETPENSQIDTLPDDYDVQNGVVRVVKIEDLDANPCCGTHLSQTSHISLIMLHSVQPVHSKNYRLNFTAGDRAISLGKSSIDAVRSIARTLSTGYSPSDVVAAVNKSREAVADLRRKETKLLREVAKHEADRIKSLLHSGQNAWVYRPVQGLDFINMVTHEIKGVETGQGVIILASGEEGRAEHIVMVGEKDCVESYVEKISATGIKLKGSAKGGRWQGKVVEWRKGGLQVLENLANLEVVSGHSNAPDKLMP